MLDAVRMCGHWISKTLLKRITARTLEPSPPTRQELLSEFCLRAGWRDRKGKLSLSSANVCVKRLEQQGLVRLPPAAPRAPRVAKRQLFDDGLPLPALPSLPKSAEQIPDLRVSLIADAQDPQHLTWNRLIHREHPLKGAPLAGAQLRYLILAGAQVVGAVGFGPPLFLSVLPRLLDWLGCPSPGTKPAPGHWSCAFSAPAWIALRQPGQPLVPTGLVAGARGLAGALRGWTGTG